MRQFWLGCIFLCGCSCLADGDDFMVVPDGGDTDSGLDGADLGPDVDPDARPDTEPDMEEGCSDERPCPPLAGQDALCTPGGFCQYTCTDGFGDCDDEPSTCEDLLSDPENCGGCNRVCESGVCTDGECDEIEQAVLGFAVGCTRRTTGRTDCWGPNEIGQVGVGDESPRYEPQQISSRFSQITAGSRGVCGIDAETNRPVCWGAALMGGVDGENSSSPRPVTSEDFAVEFDRDFVDIDALHEVVCAVDETGEVWCWGDATTGALGNGETEGGRSATPVDIVEVDPPVFVDVEVGVAHACALTDDARLYCWGSNPDGRVGADAGRVVTRPVEVSNEVTAFAVGRRNSCAIRRGALLCWGPSDSGQLALSENADEPTEIELPGEGEVDAVSVGFDVVLARVGGQWFGAGSLADGQLPLDSAEVEITSFTELPLASEFDEIEFGYSGGCSLVDGEPMCWGADLEGELRSREMIHTSPVEVDFDGLIVRSVQAGLRHACGIAEVGEEQRLLCWGDNEGMQLPGVSGFSARARPTLAGSANVRSVAAGSRHTCFLTEDEVRCVGGNERRQSGVDGETELSTPTLIEDSGMVAADAEGLSAGLRNTCAFGTRTWCWGNNTNAELGIIDMTSPFESPTRVSAGSQFIDLGRTHGCARTGTNVSCWGGNGSAQLGVPGGTAFVPTVPGVVASQVSTGAVNSCAIVGDDDEVWCWGNNTFGQSDPTMESTRAEPGRRVDFGDFGATLVAAGTEHACAAGGGRVYCWGARDRGQLGTTSDEAGLGPFATAVVRNVEQMDAGFANFTLAVDALGTAWCWGEDLYGVCGTGAPLLLQEPAPLGRRGE